MTDFPPPQLAQGVDLPDDKKFYFDGYVIAISPPDFTIVLLHNNKPLAFLNSSHIIAKSLGAAISNTIGSFEQDAQYHIPTLEEVSARIQERNKKPE